ncbi:MAG: hypothetical protein HY208_00950 [Nitrospirae bacterium]|nr:hypothetical protein [Nitrospirota bacterium]
MKRRALPRLPIGTLAISLTLLSCGTGSDSGGSGAPPGGGFGFTPKHGTLDRSFGTSGKVTTAFGTVDDEASALVLQSDNKLVAAGFSDDGTQRRFALVRYTTNEVPDTTFGPSGKVTTAIGTIDDEALALVLQTDGKLVAAGFSDDGTQRRFALVRYNTNGTLDTTFNATGKVTTAIGTIDDEAFALVQQTDGKLVAAGFSDTGTQRQFALVRYETDGSLDATFGTSGIVTSAIGTVDDEAFALVQQADGKLVAAGYETIGGQKVIALIRYNTDGNGDATFGTGSIVNTLIGSIDDEVFALVLQPDGKLVAAGFSDDGAQRRFALVRYGTNGTPDATFGAGGVVTTAIGAIDDEAFALVLQADGKLIAAGFSDDGVQRRFALVRYKADGSVDTTNFGTLGIVTTAIGTIDDEAFALVQQPDDKLVAAGFSDDGLQKRFALTRYW